MSVTLTTVNRSTAKQHYSFSKTKRFPDIASLNQNVAYNSISEFDRSPDSGNGRPFHHTSQRFKYYPSPDKSGKLPSPG